MIDAVLSYHTNSATCGVAKFNQRLARELGVPCLPLGTKTAHPLVSIKGAETKELLEEPIAWPKPPYDLFLHDCCGGELVTRAERVYAANPEVARVSRNYNPNVIEAWCPSTIEGNPHRGAINVLTFGMAHKIQTHRYEQLKTLLDATGEDYTLSVSTAIHEGSPWDETALVAERLRTVFGRRLRVLGYLGDDALAKELRECSAVALFFEPALRANNTTAWAVIDAGKALFTNRDADSPQFGYDLDTLRPDIIQRISAYGDNIRFTPPEGYAWSDLTRLLQGQPCEK